MPEIVVTPSGPGACEAGLMLDEHGRRFVVLSFREEGGDPVIVTFERELFDRYLTVLNRTGEAAADERNWATA